MSDNLNVRFLGLISYDRGLELMRELHEARSRDETDDTILVLEHESVVTKGRRLHDAPLPGEARLAERGIVVRDADRGGLLTYHGPGQVVVYFILRLKDYFDGVAGLVDCLEGVLRGFLKKHGVVSQTRPDHPGVWVGGLKVASLGLRVENGVTRHGVSLNLNNDLSVYRLFDPCGLSGECMTTLERLTGRSVTPDDFLDLSRDLGRRFAESLRASRVPERRIA